MFVGQVAFVAMSSLSFQFISKSDIFTTKIDTGSKPFLWNSFVPMHNMFVLVDMEII